GGNAARVEIWVGKACKMGFHGAGEVDPKDRPPWVGPNHCVDASDRPTSCRRRRKDLAARKVLVHVPMEVDNEGASGR
ncbi:hypothetical protein ABTL22_20055, partial [Acinetobacter baumannii]